METKRIWILQLVLIISVSVGGFGILSYLLVISMKDIDNPFIRYLGAGILGLMNTVYTAAGIFSFYIGLHKAKEAKEAQKDEQV